MKSLRGHDNSNCIPILNRLLVFMTASFVAAPLALAYFVAVPQGPATLNHVLPARILVSGRGATLGDQPQLSALAKSFLYRQNFPSDSVVLISVFENAENESQLIQNGWVFVVNNDLKLDTDSVMTELLKFQKIRSLEFFGHNSPSLGTQTDGLTFRFDFRRSVVAKLTPHFDRGAFAIIHGCNSGWISAQNLSVLWKVPVAGSFTGTRFERLHTDGHFYVDETDKFPAGGWAKTNPDLSDAKCLAGACLRMRPGYSLYKGHWGNLEGPTLSHYKFFCSLNSAECEKRMALSLYGFLAEKSLRPQSNFADYREVARQFLCPVYKDRKITEDCFSQLDLIERGQGNDFISFVVKDPQLSCSFQSCAARLSCTDESCQVQVPAVIARPEPKSSSTLADEYRHYINGFQSLQRDGF